MDLSEYLGLFLDESRENLQALNASLLALERDPDDRDALHTIFRAAHSLKGMSATMGYDRMAGLTHRMEEVLSVLRDGDAPVSTEVVDVLFACLDLLEGLVNDVADGAGEARADTAPLLARLDAAAGAAARAPAPPPPSPRTTSTAADAPAGDPAALGDYERMVVQQAHQAGMHVHALVVTLADGCLLKAARVYMVVQELERLGEIVKAEPTTGELEQETFDREFTLWVASATGADELRAAALKVTEVRDCVVTALEAGGVEAHAVDDAAEPEPAVRDDPRAGAGADDDAITARATAEARARKRQPTTVRVGTDRLDSLMNLMGEMVIQRTRLTQLAVDHALPDLRQTVEDVTRVTNDLQTLIMQVRMMPVEAVFMRFPRMVRDLAQSLGKQLELTIAGEDTELDRTVIDELGDPLVHLLRNAVDHGLETPHERVARGKPPVGSLRLTAGHEGNNVVIVVEEDGRGIDPERIRSAVVAKGLLDADEVAALSDREAVELILLPGFSTVAEATDVSGRGVGMDAVRAKIAGLNGSVDIHSAVGVGSRFTIRLPLTLAIIQALLVRAAGETYALPLEAIEETLIVRPDETRPVAGRDCMVLRDRVVPLVHLRERLRLDRGEEVADVLSVVVVKSAGDRIGVVVDRLVGQQEIVIKHLPPYLGDVVGVAGATILGDGQVALIVDVGALGGSQMTGVTA